MGTRTDRMGRSAIALSIVGVILVIIAVSTAYAFVRPRLSSSRVELPETTTPRRVAGAASAGDEVALLAEQNETVLESAATTAPPTSTVEATGTVGSQSSTSSVAAGPGSGGPPPAAGQGAGTDPVVPGTDGSAAEPGSPPGGVCGYVTGSVTHAVWGSPLAGVRVALSPGGSTTTAADGAFLLATHPMNPGSTSLCTLAVAQSGSGLRSYAALSRGVAVGAGHVVPSDFKLYYASESAGTDWRTASWWAAWRTAYSTADMNVLLSRVSHASAEFANLGVGDADAILEARSRGSSRSRARAEHLALWLDLASARLGLDHPTARANVRGWGSVGGGGALSLARELDAVFSSGADANWTDVRKACTGDSTDG